MILKLEAGQEELDRLISAAAEINPLAAQLKRVRLDEAKLQARVETPAGEVKVDLELTVTPDG